MSAKTSDADDYEHCASGYSLKYGLPNLSDEHPLDQAMRCNDVALRCYYEEHGLRQTRNKFHLLTPEQRKAYDRLPVVHASGLHPGAYYVRTYDGRYQEIAKADAADHPMFAFQAK